MPLPCVMAFTLITMAHCDAVGMGIHAIRKGLATVRQISRIRANLLCLRH